jgi:hypothetical protein
MVSLFVRAGAKRSTRTDGDRTPQQQRRLLPKNFLSMKGIKEFAGYQRTSQDSREFCVVNHGFDATRAYYERLEQKRGFRRSPGAIRAFLQLESNTSRRLALKSQAREEFTDPQ